MTLASVSGLMIPPPISTTSTHVFSIASVMDASGEKTAVVVFAPKTGSIRKIHFRTGAVTTPTDTDVRVETVSATDGNPTGSLWAANTNVTVPSASITANTYIVTGALTADAVVTKGDRLAIVIAPSGSPNFQTTYYNTGATGQYLQYLVSFTAAWGVKSNVEPYIGLEYSDGSFAYMPGVQIPSALTTETVGSGSTPDEVALKFTLPGPARIAGFWFYADMDGDCDVVLYDSDGSTPLLTKSLDKDIRQNSNPFSPVIGYFNSNASLLANTAYRIALKPSSATTMAIYTITVNSAAVMDQYAGGQAFHLSHRVDAGAWTNVTTRRPFIGLILDQIDDGTGSGSGGSLHHGLLPPHFHPHGGRR